MRKFLFLFLLLSVSGCLKRYVRITEDRLDSVDERTVTFHMIPISMPSIDSPYIVVQTKEIVRVLEVYEHQEIEKEPIISAVFPFPLIGLIPGLLIMPTGYVVLGRDIIGVSVASLLLGNVLSCSDKKVTKSRNVRRFEERIPCDKEFILSLVGEDSSVKYSPDSEGFLKMNIADFSSFYEEDEDFEFKLISPIATSITLQVPTSEISSLLLRKKKDN